MEMRIHWRGVVLGMGLLGLLAVPMVARADRARVSIKIGSDDQAHFDFKAGESAHHPMIWKAAKQLRNAKHTLLKAADDFHGHKMEAIRAIDGALDQLRICESR